MVNQSCITIFVSIVVTEFYLGQIYPQFELSMRPMEKGKQAASHWHTLDRTANHSDFQYPSGTLEKRELGGVAESGQHKVSVKRESDERCIGDLHFVVLDSAIV